MLNVIRKLLWMASREGYDRGLSLPILAIYSWNELRESQKSQLQQLLGLMPNEDGFCSLGTTRNRRTMTRSKLFVSARKLWEQRPQLQKLVLGSSTSEDGFKSSGTKRDRTAQTLSIIEERCQNQSYFFQGRKKTQEQMPQPQKNCPGFNFQWIWFLWIKN